MTWGLRLLPLLVLTTLVGCTSLAMQRANLPMQIDTAVAQLPADYEVQATVHISKGAVQETYLLALSTRRNAFSAAFLSPQGIPIYSLRLTEGRLRVSSQTAIGEHLDPLQMLGYLELMYLEESDMPALINDHWRWESLAGERLFVNDGNAAPATESISIHFSGTGPWHSPVVLTDDHEDMQLTVRILEAKRVFPQ
ncbi:MAG: DUF3261 domain-containing protein [Halieaceae bacterium]|jgi:hypothetical protein|nr:DUF3261 domain-containing protein [Halieaceae bacterium]